MLYEALHESDTSELNLRLRPGLGLVQEPGMRLGHRLELELGLRPGLGLVRNLKRNGH